MSLADELLADLEEGDDNLETNDAEEPEEVTEVTDIVMEVDTSRHSVRSVAKLRDSKEVRRLILFNIFKICS